MTPIDSGPAGRDLYELTRDEALQHLICPQQQHGGDLQLQAGQHEDDLHKLHRPNTSRFLPQLKMACNCLELAIIAMCHE
ncbi:unnamed protein product [Pleuronectes platessa]|uniref:Uncharacterized protein n=1 Tax=Pleuronectes platessa TaxID=8262 RepID=A0A9N7UI67_PLEPL|nr:unnamed protein product [Pleuronectes platessa]